MKNLRVRATGEGVHGKLVFVFLESNNNEIF